MAPRRGPRSRSIKMKLDSKKLTKTAMQTVGGILFSSTTEKEFDIERRDSKFDAGRRKVLLRDWLLLQVNESRIPGLEWIQVDGQRYLKVPWVHGSKASWTIDDSKVFESWAKYTGKFYSSPRDSKRWKANFRCAINSLPDVREMKSLGCRDGIGAFKVYQFLPEHPRKHRITPELKLRTKMPSIDFPSPLSPSTSTALLQIPPKTSFEKKDEVLTDERRSNLKQIYIDISSTEEAPLFHCLPSSSPPPSFTVLPPISSSLSSSSSSSTSSSSWSSSSSSGQSSCLLPLHVLQMNVDDDNDSDDDDNDSDRPSRTKEIEVDSSDADDEDDDDEDSGDENYGDKQMFSNADANAIGTSVPDCGSDQLRTMIEMSHLTSAEEIDIQIVEPTAIDSAQIPTSTIISSASLVNMPVHNRSTRSFTGMESLELPASDFREILEGISLPELLHLHQFNDNESEDCECLFANDYVYTNI